MKKIPLTQGRFALVDDEDFDFLSQWRWHLSDNGYAQRSVYIKIDIGRYTSRMVKMHRIINETPPGVITDHINRNKLDNRKMNLRSVSASINSLNRGELRNNKSGKSGVHFERCTGKWRAEIIVYGKRISIGRFAELKDAIIARQSTEKQYAI